MGAGAACGDCDDSDAAVNPEGEEIPADGVDSDCDGTEQCYVDADGDAYENQGKPENGICDNLFCVPYDLHIF